MIIGSDGIGYYMYSRSLIIDGDINFENEYSRLKPEVNLETLKTPTGLTSNQYAVGPGLMWAPFFAITHSIILGLNHMGFKISNDGYGYPYQIAICVGSIFYGFWGIALIYRTVNKFYPKIALFTCILIWLATNVIYYMVAEPSMSHACSLFATSIFIYVWLKTRNSFSLFWCLLIGLSGGFVALVRQVDGTLLILPILDIIFNNQDIKDILKKVFCIALSFFAIFSIQMGVWFILNGNPFLSGYFLNSSYGFSWLHPHFFEVFFSTEHGLFLWHPVLLLAVIGFLFFYKIDHKLTLLLVIGIISQGYLIGAWSSWTQADAFGGRMFIGSLPIFAIGLAAFGDWTERSRFLALYILVGGLLIIWNALFFFQYRFGFISMNGPYSLGELFLGKASMLQSLFRKVVDVLQR